MVPPESTAGSAAGAADASVGAGAPAGEAKADAGGKGDDVIDAEFEVKE